MPDLMEMMKQARELQERLESLQREVAAMEIEGSAGGGLVRVTVDGKGGLKAVNIDPSVVKPDEVEILEDLIVAAVSEARGKAESAAQSKMQELAGGLPLPPGFTLPT
jgi:DNA-binding YbaB/EbfC family protein